jgi:hypothetical protein
MEFFQNFYKLKDKVNLDTIIQYHSTSPYINVENHLKFFKFPFKQLIKDINVNVNAKNTFEDFQRYCHSTLEKEYIMYLRSFITNEDTTSIKKIVINRPKNNVVVKAHEGPKPHVRTFGENTLNYLKDNGYTEYFLEHMSLQEQIDLFNSASHIVAIHGGALTNILFCREGAKVIEINSGYNPFCYLKLARSFYLKTGINAEIYNLFKDEHMSALEEYTGDIPNNNHYNLKIPIFKTSSNTYHTIKDENVFRNINNKLASNIEFDLNKLKDLI